MTHKRHSGGTSCHSMSSCTLPGIDSSSSDGLDVGQASFENGRTSTHDILFSVCNFSFRIRLSARVLNLVVGISHIIAAYLCSQNVSKMVCKINGTHQQVAMKYFFTTSSGTGSYDSATASMSSPHCWACCRLKSIDEVLSVPH
jgi:hypothetical protein